MFDKMEAGHPGAAKTLKAKADALRAELAADKAPAGVNLTASQFAAHKIDVTIVYCTATRTLERASSDLVSTPAPPELDPHPIYGLVVLSTNPAAKKMADYILSDDGQGAVASSGFLPARLP